MSSKTFKENFFKCFFKYHEIRRFSCKIRSSNLNLPTGDGVGCAVVEKLAGVAKEGEDMLSILHPKSFTIPHIK